MAALIGGILAASLLGSLHCAGMCGAFAAFAVMPGGTGAGGRVPLHLAYHGGRLLVYVTLGAVAGLLGAALNVGGALVGLQRVAALLAGSLLVGAGGVAALRLAGVRVPSAAAAPWLGQWIRRGHAAARGWPPVLRALAVGLLTTFLPCGWLWAFVLTAAGTGQPLLGAVTLAAFWLGTLPVLVVIGAGIQRMAGAVGLRAQLVACLAVIALGLWSLAGRWQALAVPRTSGPPAVHEAGEGREPPHGAHPTGCPHGP